MPLVSPLTQLLAMPYFARESNHSVVSHTLTKRDVRAFTSRRIGSWDSIIWHAARFATRRFSMNQNSQLMEIDIRIATAPLGEQS